MRSSFTQSFAGELSELSDDALGEGAKDQCGKEHDLHDAVCGMAGSPAKPVSQFRRGLAGRNFSSCNRMARHGLEERFGRTR